MDTLTHLARVVVDEADGLIFVVLVLVDVANDHLARVARAVDQDAFRAAETSERLVETASQSKPAEAEDEQERVDDEHGARVA